MYLIFSLIVIALTISALFSLEGVQTWAGQRAVSWVNKEYQTTIQFQRLKYQWPNHFEFFDLYIPDTANRDTLLAIPHLKSQFLSYSKNKNQLKLGYVQADGAVIKMIKHQSDSLFNMMVFINAFSKEKKQNKKALELDVASFYLDNITYKKLQPDCERCAQIRLKDAVLAGNDFKMDSLDIAVTIGQLRYKDADRFDLKHLDGKVVWTPAFVQLDSLNFETEASKVALKGVMQTDSLRGYANFLEQVKLNVQIDAPSISSKEFQMWLPQFPNFDNFGISGSAIGTVLDFNANNLTVTLGSHTRFTGAVGLVNCIDPKTLQLNTQVVELKTHPDDLEKYLFQFIDTVPDLDFSKLGTIKLTGSYSGTVETFEVSGAITSAFGELSGDLTLSDLRDLEKVAYEGRLLFKDFAMDLFTGEQRFGPMTAIGVVKGSGIQKDQLRTLVDLRIASLVFNNYPYRNIMANGFVADRQFSGKFTAKDPNFDFDFDGTVAFQTDSTIFDFKATLYRADLFALKLSEDEISICSGNAKIDFIYTKATDWIGDIIINEMQYSSIEKEYFFEALHLKSEINKLQKRFTVSSDLFDAELKGQFELNELLPSYQFIAQSVYPPAPPVSGRLPKTVTLDIDVKSAQLVYDLFLPKFYASSNSHLHLLFDSQNELFDLTIYAPEISWEGHQLLHLNQQTSGKFYQLQTQIEFAHYKKGELEVDSLLIALQQQHKETEIHIRDQRYEKPLPVVELSGKVVFMPEKGIGIAVQPGFFNVRGSTFRLERENTLIINDNRVEVTNFELIQDEGLLSLNGIISKNPHEVIRAKVKNMPLDILNGVLDFPFLVFEGSLNGEVIGSDVFKAPKFFADITLDSLLLNDSFLGQLVFQSHWDIASEVVSFEGELSKEEETQLDFSGNFQPFDNQEILLVAGFNRFEANFLDPIFKDVFSDVSGRVNGRFQMSGPIKQPTFETRLELAAVQLSIPYLNTTYQVVGNPEITITSNRIDLGEFGIQDVKYGTTGNVSGWLEHNVFKNFKFNVRVEAANLLALNTTASVANYYYGTAFAKGVVNIAGSVQNLNIQMDATSVGDSKINIPLDNPTEISQQSFVTFVKASNTIEKQKSVLEGLEGITLDLSFNMTPAAEVTLQLDPTAGGAIKGRGSGRVRLLLDASGELEMFGNYQIESGEYQFVLQRIVNKPFKVVQGSSVSWTGDPFNAQLDIRAVYATRTSLTGVVTNTSYRGNRVNVDLNLLLSGYLLDTEITFDIQLPQSDPAFQEELNSRFNDPDKLNEQAFSLLVYNSFFDPGVSAGGNIGSLASSALGANAMQGLSAQVSNFLNKGAGDWVDINVAYNPGGVNTAANADPLLQSQEEIALDLSRQFFDDRVVINSVFDVPVGANPNRLAGNISVEYKITPDGRIRTKFFNRSNLDNPYVDQLAPYSQGVGIFYRKDFDVFRFWRLRNRAAKKEEEDS